MPLNFYSQKNIDRKKWDFCIENALDTQIYAVSWYLDCVCEHWNALIWEENSEYLAVMPLPMLRKFGISFVKQSLFCQQLGIFIRKNVQNIDYQEFIKTIFQKFSFISNYQFHTNHVLLDFLEIQKNEIFTYELDLRCSYSSIYKKYHSDRRNNVKKVKTSKLIIFESENIDELILMFEENVAKKIAGGVAENAYFLLKKLFEELKQRKMAKLFYTKNQENQIGAGALFVFYQNKIIYLFNASYIDFRKENGRTLILDHIFEKFSEKEYIFDFESPMISQIASFYESFGAEKKYFSQIAYNRLPFWVNILWKITKKIKKLWKNF